MVKVGERVGAICSANEKLVRLYGYGVYAGDHHGGPMDQFAGEPYLNPRIDLDGGGIVWGCECWWGPEDKVRKSIGEREVIMEPLPDRPAVSASAGPIL